ncbi:MAG: oligosaccharide flippase family protein [Candidatus Omnitrophota bacterium]
MPRSVDKKDILKDASFFSGSVYISQAMFFIRGFLNARILGPGLYGLWSALNIILSYSLYVHMGSLNAMNREIPYQKGRDALEDMDKTRNAAFTVNLVMSGMFSAILVVVALFLSGKISKAESIGLITVALLAFISAIYEFCQTSLISFKRFMVVSRGNVIFAILSVILTLWLLPLLSIYGVYIVAVSIPLFNLAYLWFKERYNPRLDFDFKEMHRLIKIGFPMMSIDFLETTITNIIGIIVLGMLGNVNFAYYSVSMLAARFMMYFPKSVNRAFEPHMYQRYGETGRIIDLKKYLIKPIQVMTLIFPVLIAGCYILVEFFIRHFLPKYSLAMYPLFIILVSRFFVSFSPTSIAFITALNKQKFLIPVYVFGIAIGAGCSFVFIKIGFGTVGAAMGLLLSCFFIGSVMFLYAINEYTRDFIKTIGYLAVSCIPLLYIMSVVVFNEVIIKNSQDLPSDIFIVILKLGSLLILSFPLIYIANKKTGILTDIFKRLSA